MELLVGLHGKFHGFIRLQVSENKTNYTVRGIPAESQIFAVCNNKPILVSSLHNKLKKGDKISNIIVLDKSGKTIMEGAVRGFMPFNPFKNGVPMPDSSEYLQEVLKKADSLFSSIKDTEAVRADKPEQSPKKSGVFNPFSTMYPNSTWKRFKDRSGRLKKIEGNANVAGQTLHIVAIPISLYSEAFFINNGYNKHIKSDDGNIFRAKIIVQTNKGL